MTTMTTKSAMERFGALWRRGQMGGNVETWCFFLASKYASLWELRPFKLANLQPLLYSKRRKLRLCANGFRSLPLIRRQCPCPTGLLLLNEGNKCSNKRFFE